MHQERRYPHAIVCTVNDSGPYFRPARTIEGKKFLFGRLEGNPYVWKGFQKKNGRRAEQGIPDHLERRSSFHKANLIRLMNRVSAYSLACLKTSFVLVLGSPILNATWERSSWRPRASASTRLNFESMVAQECVARGSFMGSLDTRMIFRSNVLEQDAVRGEKSS